MSRLRHKEKERAKGGSVKEEFYAGGGSNVAKEAEEKKKGGRVHVEGEGEKAKHRADRPKRARGGRMRGEGVGSDKMPLTSAAKIREVVKGEEPQDSPKDE